MAASARPARLIFALAVALLLAYFLTWLQLSHTSIGRSDFSASYVGGTLLRSGHSAVLYDDATQAALRNKLIGSDRQGSVPFDDAPVAAAIVAPLTLLGLDAAYRLWSVLQVLVLGAAVLIAVRAAPWPRGISAAWQAAAGAAGIAAMGTWVLLIQGQWSALTALGLALAYRDWRHGHQMRGAALMVVVAGAAKPHLALGLAFFLLGWRDRRAMVGAAAGALVLVAASLALVGPSGIAAFAGQAASQATKWDLRTMVSFVGIPGSLLGTGSAARLVGAAASILAWLVAWRLGLLVRRDIRRLDAALAAAVVLSLLAAPHAYSQDLVMLAPVLAWSAAAAWRAGAERLALLFGAWALISVAAFADFLDGAMVPPGQLTAWALLVAAFAGWRWAERTPIATAAEASRERGASTLAHA